MVIDVFFTHGAMMTNLNLTHYVVRQLKECHDGVWSYYDRVILHLFSLSCLDYEEHLNIRGFDIWNCT